MIDSELVDLYRGVDVVVAPSRVEGFGIVPLEAMARGTLTVVAAGSGALEEISGQVVLVVLDRIPAAWQTASTLEVLQLAADPAVSASPRPSGSS